MIVTSDLTGAYQNIQQKDGIKCLNEALEDRVKKEIPSDFLTKLMELHSQQIYLNLIKIFGNN